MDAPTHPAPGAPLVSPEQPPGEQQRPHEGQQRADNAEQIGHVAASALGRARVER